MRPATPEDRNWIVAHLRRHVTTSMFALSNLADHGWDSDEPRAMTFWLDPEAGWLFGVTNEGMMLPQMCEGFDRLPGLLAGRRAMGAAGEASQVRALLPALGLADAPAVIDEDEPQFVLDLDRLTVPDGPGRLVPASVLAQDVLGNWREAYLIETIGEDPASARPVAEADAERFRASDRFRFLLDGTTPLSLSGLNADLPEIVQVGGVFTPRELRGKGHARRAVALHLAECARRGVRTATLFAANAPAVRAYEALGFERVGSFALTLFRSPMEIRA